MAASALIDEKGVAYCADIANRLNLPETGVARYLDSVAEGLGLVIGEDLRGVYFEPMDIEEKKILGIGDCFWFQTEKGCLLLTKMKNT